MADAQSVLPHYRVKAQRIDITRSSVITILCRITMSLGIIDQITLAASLMQHDIRCMARQKLVRDVRIELTTTEWKSVVLPLN